MRFLLPFFIMVCLLDLSGTAQTSCASREYLDQELRNNPALAVQLQQQEARMNNQFLQERLSNTSGNSKEGLPVITIPVVVHVLYNKPDQNLSDAQILSQLDVLNREFRMQHADTTMIPPKFRNLAADCYLKFALAKVTPQGYATTGIVRKATKIYSFGLDDRIKFSSMGGDDAWDSKRYLNIWVGNLVSGVIGYSSPLGGPAEKDGLAISYFAFGTTGNIKAPYTKGRTAVHELGHWMGLRHIWGDQFCGNDGIDDTPPQSNATRGCPSGMVVSTCGIPEIGNMYNNYMDLTNDDCTNMFTVGQRDKMRAAFLPGAPHHALLESDALTATPKPGVPPELQKTLSSVIVYPNPAISRVTLDVSNRQEMVGSSVSLINQLGQEMMQVRITGNLTPVSIGHLKEGIYFLKSTQAALPVKIIKGSGSTIRL